VKRAREEGRQVGGDYQFTPPSIGVDVDAVNHFVDQVAGLDDRGLIAQELLQHSQSFTRPLPEFGFIHREIGLPGAFQDLL